jgi:hypothetical protein
VAKGTKREWFDPGRSRVFSEDIAALSVQLEMGLRTASTPLVRKATRLYKLTPAALPLPELFDLQPMRPDDLQKKLASLGYAGFEHIRAAQMSNPAEVVFSAIVKRDLDTRLVEALPWVLKTYTDMNWEWLRDRAKLQNVQNRLGYLVHLARETARALRQPGAAVAILSIWENQLEDARLAAEGTLCRDSMSEPERGWLRANRPLAAARWGLLTSITIDQLPYATD